VSYAVPELTAARSLVAQTLAMLERAPSFRQLDPASQAAMLADFGSIRQALDTAPVGSALSSGCPGPAPSVDPYALAALTATLAAGDSASGDPYALSLATPLDRLRGARGQPPAAQNGPTGPAAPAGQPAPGGTAATETIARRAGALSDEIDFPSFVAGLVHGTFDAIMDANIRQMETFADLVGAVAKDVDEFTRDNITAEQVRDWLVQRYPNDLALEVSGGRPKLRSQAHRDPGEQADEAQGPAWLADFGLESQELTDEVIEDQLVPSARRAVGEQRLQMLATMVLMGMSRVNIRDGSISARLRFRALARDRANVAYSQGTEPGGGGWGSRGSSTYAQHSTMVSTVGVNVQAESELKAELFGEVKINFASETLPLERFVDSALLTLLQRNARPISQPGAARRPAPSNGAAPGAPSAAPALPANEPPLAGQSPAPGQ
jgi:hypothetical protein